MGLKDRLKARSLPTEVVTLPPAGEGDDPERVTLTALLPKVWEDLVLAHPPTPEEQEGGAWWHVETFRPAVLEACVVTPEGEDPLTAADWQELATGGHLAAGELVLLFNVAVRLNDRSPLMSVGKA
jgi:hypothetical protein